MVLFRKACPKDIPEIMNIVHQAQAFMATLGIDQWQDGYPSQAQIAADIAFGGSYVLEQDGAVVATAYFTCEPEPAYADIDGAWHTAEPCLTLHRLALGDGVRHSGLASELLAHAFEIARAQRLCGVRVDTHRGNVVMRRFLEKSGFSECGLVQYPRTIGDPIRVAYDFPIELS